MIALILTIVIPVTAFPTGMPAEEAVSAFPSGSPDEVAAIILHTNGGWPAQQMEAGSS